MEPALRDGPDVVGLVEEPIRNCCFHTVSNWILQRLCIYGEQESFN